MLYVSVVCDVVASKCHQKYCCHWVQMPLLCATGLSMHFHALQNGFITAARYCLWLLHKINITSNFGPL